jgi:Protein of unknown function (DUF3631)
VAVELLFDIADVFSLLADDEDLIETRVLLKRNAQPEWRWATYSNGRPMTAHALAQFLKAFDIFPTTGSGESACARIAGPRSTTPSSAMGWVQARESEEPNEHAAEGALVKVPKS